MDSSNILITASLFEVVMQAVYGESSSSCFGTQPCDFFSMQCPSNQVIKLNNLYAGYKNTTIYPICENADRHCELEATCCSYASGGDDILELLTLENIYHTYTNCSGRQSCTDVQANWQLLQTTARNGDLIYSSFVRLEYDCEEASSKIPFCGGPTGTNTGIYSYAEIMFDGSLGKFDPTKASKYCLCSVTNRGSQQNVIFKTIDVRLESHQKGLNQSVANCSSAFFRSNVLAAQCSPTDQHYRYNFYNSKQETIVMPAGTVSEISLTDLHVKGALDSPAIVWISLKAEVNNGIQVTCKEMESADFTTTPTTTTTSTTTTTTTATITTEPKLTSYTTPMTNQTSTTPATRTQMPTTTTQKRAPVPTTTTPSSTISSLPPTTTTTTTLKPTTTTKLTTEKTQKPTLITQKQSILIPSTTSKITTTTISKTTTTNYIPSEEGLDRDDEKTTYVTLILAINLPLITCLVAITSFCLWLNWRRNTLLRKSLNSHSDIQLRRNPYDYIDEGTVGTISGVLQQQISQPTTTSDLNYDNLNPEYERPYDLLSVNTENFT